MGYYTLYNIKTEPPTENLVISHDYGLETDGKGTCDTDTIKWYDHDKDLREVSAANPEILITVDGVGEESLDIWRKYYKGGMCQEWRMPDPTPEPFDPAKLRSK